MSSRVPGHQTFHPDGTCTVVRRSGFTGIVHEATLPITPEEYLQWERGHNIQDCFPNLTPIEREFLMTGITPKEWSDAFGKGRQ